VNVPSALLVTVVGRRSYPLVTGSTVSSSTEGAAAVEVEVEAEAEAEAFDCREAWVAEVAVGPKVTETRRGFAVASVAAPLGAYAWTWTAPSERRPEGIVMGFADPACPIASEPSDVAVGIPTVTRSVPAVLVTVEASVGLTVTTLTGTVPLATPTIKSAAPAKITPPRCAWTSAMNFVKTCGAVAPPVMALWAAWRSLSNKVWVLASLMA